MSAAALLLLFAAAAGAQRPAPAPPGSDGIAGFGRCGHEAVGRQPPPEEPSPLRRTTQLCVEDRAEDGFVDLFNGRDLSGWQGEAGRWTVENGVLTGRTTAATPLSANTFLIWTGKPPVDFDLQFEWRLSSGGNSGVQYRSERMKVPALGRYVLRGPQFDMGGPDEAFTGNIFEERGPTFLATRGSFAVDTGPRRETIGFVGSHSASRGLIRTGDWNRGEIVARGGTIVHLINGQVVGVLIDQAPTRRRAGTFGIQLHVGPPMTIEYQSIRMKPL